METEQTFIPEQYHRRATVKRILGTVLFIGITFTMLVEVSVLVGWSSVQDTLVDYSSKNATQSPSIPVEDYSSENTNQSLCTYLKTLKLSSSKKVSICTYKQSVRVDIRRFIGPRATIQGIWLNMQEWRTLLRLWGRIQMNITNAENYLT